MGKNDVEKTQWSWADADKLSATEDINQRQYALVAVDESIGLFPAENKKSTGAAPGDAAAMVTLRSYFSGIITRKMFMDAVGQLISLVINSESDRLDVSNLALSLDNIFVDPETKDVKCILWALTDDQNARKPAEFFQSLPYELDFDNDEDCTYVTQYKQFFHTLPKQFAMRDLRLLFTGETPEPRPGEERGASATAPSFDPLQRIIDQKTGAAWKNVCPNCGIVNAMGAKICVSCSASLIEQSDMDIKVKSGTAVLGYAPGSTELESEESPYPYLIRERTNQIISVDKPEFHIGKDKKTSDFCVTDNTAISRRHAVIYIREDRYFILDQNSTNRTYLDGRAIAPNQEIEIFPATKIKLANEEFVFYI